MDSAPIDHGSNAIQASHSLDEPSQPASRVPAEQRPPTLLHVSPTEGLDAADDAGVTQPAPTAADLTEYFATLGLHSSADHDLVELAYWYHVDACRERLLGSPTWAVRLAELNRARHELSQLVVHAPDIQEESAPDDAHSPIGWTRAVMAGTLVFVLFSYILGARFAGWDQGKIAAGSFALLAIAAFAAILAIDRAGSVEELPPPPDPDPYTLLRVLHSADQGLITTAYRHQLRVAAARGDPDMLDTLERAYRRIGTPAARAAYDLRAAGTGELPAAPPAAHPASAARIASERTAPRHGRGPALRPLARLLPSGRRDRNSYSPRPVAQWTDEHDAPIPGFNARRSSRATGVLRVTHGDREIVTLVLREGAVYVIGADPHCDVRLPADGGGAGRGPVAGEHARLTVGRGRLVFHHTAAGAASFINGERTVWALLEAGDILAIGPYQCHYVSALHSGRTARVTRDPSAE